MFACKNGHIDVVQLLLDHSDQNIDLNARNNVGRTAFMWASFNGHEDVYSFSISAVQLFLSSSQSGYIQVLIDGEFEY